MKAGRSGSFSDKVAYESATRRLRLPDAVIHTRLPDRREFLVAPRHVRATESAGSVFAEAGLFFKEMHCTHLMSMVECATS